MTDPAHAAKPERPPLPRDAFRAQRVNPTGSEAATSKPVIVTPRYDDPVMTPVATAERGPPVDVPVVAGPRKPSRVVKATERNPFEGYGERSSSRPYALRLPDPIDLVVRQIAAEERTQPLRIIDRAVHDYLKRIGRLPPPQGI